MVAGIRTWRSRPTDRAGCTRFMSKCGVWPELDLSAWLFCEDQLLLMAGSGARFEEIVRSNEPHQLD
ncbi:unnamed protein product [Protopolystoma xenopodis]|uniref:Uncharacterized protein n=1 Tax=Protopolystoma xenopodis TaxID=117903 RepID=A0A448XHY2_9PLAT|nr:unnamed protein product [Protopolystoma xenopodis]